MRRRQPTATPMRNLTDRQKYLLQRIPARYDMNGVAEVPKPKAVIQAEKVVDRWNKAEGLRTCQANKRNEALIRKAREAVYFCDDQKALAIVQQCEKLLKGCKKGGLTWRPTTRGRQQWEGQR